VKRRKATPTAWRSTPPAPTPCSAPASSGIAPEHPLAEQLAAADPAVAAFVAECRKGGTSEADIEGAEKLGRDTGLRVVHPLDPTLTLPVWIANFILMDYGTGAIFACPAHDQRDLDFARKYDLPVLPVVLPPGEDAATFQVGKEAYVGPGAIFNSEFLDGLDIEAAKTEAVNRIEAMDQGQGATVYRLRDWGVSRQRYWGCPIPVIHCAACGPVGVPEDQLPVVLPDDVAFDKPGNPLLRHPTWRTPPAPAAAARPSARPTRWTPSSTAPGTSPASPTRPPRADRQGRRRPLDAGRPVYRRRRARGAAPAVRPLHHPRPEGRGPAVGGGAVRGPVHPGHGHPRGLQERRRRMGRPSDVVITVEGNSRSARHAATGEPIVIGDIEKMSKSKKNVVAPEDIFEAYGVDAARLFVMSDSPPERDVQWTNSGVEGSWRFTHRVWNEFESQPAGDFAHDDADAAPWPCARAPIA
jgi:leucyl-tRNA synthetase